MAPNHVARGLVPRCRFEYSVRISAGTHNRQRSIPSSTSPAIGVGYMGTTPTSPPPLPAGDKPPRYACWGPMPRYVHGTPSAVSLPTTMPGARAQGCISETGPDSSFFDPCVLDTVSLPIILRSEAKVFRYLRPKRVFIEAHEIQDVVPRGPENLCAGTPRHLGSFLS